MSQPILPATRRYVAVWLFVCAAMVFGTLVVGGVTRLTHSGLSIVEWDPIVGVVPPLSGAQWNATFDQYKLTPEYRDVNRGMSLDDFKGIFWWEYWHRILGRSIGFVFLLPFLYFAFKRDIGRKLTLRLSGIFCLGALQGALGWFMVKSGLVADPRVSQYRLTAHLSLAVIIFSLMVWLSLGLLGVRGGQFDARRRALQRSATAILLLIYYMVLTGGFVAGIRAGKAYNTFPLMNGYVVPPEIMMLHPWYLNFFNNMATVQFDHRLGAWTLAIVVPWFWWRARQAALGARARLACNILLAWLAVQISLGISTLLLAVPVALAATHQASAIVLLTLTLWVNHELRLPQAARLGKSGVDD